MRPLDRRTLLSMERNPVPIPGFAETLERVRKEARPIAQVGITLPNVDAIRQWHDHTLRNVRSSAGHSTGLTHAILGVALDEIGQSFIQHANPQKHLLGLDFSVEAQQHLTQAFLALARQDRRTLGQSQSIEYSRAVVGAVAVARLVAALEQRGVKSYLPSIDEDRSLGIDLFVRRKNRKGRCACVQVKAVGKKSRAYLETNPDERLFWGTEVLNAEHDATWIPIRADVCVRHVPRATPVEEHARNAAKQVHSLLCT